MFSKDFRIIYALASGFYSVLDTKSLIYIEVDTDMNIRRFVHFAVVCEISDQ